MHVISFLLQMGFREVGVPFPLASLNPLQANIAAHLSQLGLIAPFRLLLLLLLTLSAPAATIASMSTSSACTMSGYR